MSSPFIGVFLNLHEFCARHSDLEPPEVRLVFKDRMHRSRFKWAVKRELQFDMPQEWDLEDRNIVRMMDIPVKLQLKADGDPLAEISRLLEENRKLRAAIATASKALTP